MSTFEIIERQGLKMIKCTIENELVRAESGTLHYMVGQIQMDVAAPTLGGFLKSMASGENVIRPTYRGTGTIYFGPPMFGEYTVLELQGHQWIIDRGAYICSDAGINVNIWRNKGLAAIAGGEGFWQTMVEGTGRCVIKSGGPLEAIDLNNGRLVVEGTFAVARTGNINFTIQKSSRGIMASIASGEGLVHVFEGTGRVLIAPVPNTMHNMIDAIVGAIPVSSSS